MKSAKSFRFEIIAKDSKTKARAGKIVTPHGVIETPCFIPVGTRATVRSLTPQDLEEIGVQILFGNTYHLHLAPGEDVVEEFGGLGNFMGWSGPTITDSGGFQVFSLGSERKERLPNLLDSTHSLNDSSALVFAPSSNLAREDFLKDQPKEKLFKSSFRGESRPPALVGITNDGVIFRSHLDGSLHNFTPEKSIEIQKKLGADIILVFDQCPPYPSSYQDTKKATERTHEWAVRSLKRHGLLRGKQALYGIVQGGVYKDLREESAKFISGLDFDGIAIGGVAVGESKKQMRDVLDYVSPILPDEKPRHLLGIGEIDDIFDCIERGMDTFDCVIPTRFGRYGIIFVSPPEGTIKNRFRIDINKTAFAKDPPTSQARALRAGKSPIDENCHCYTCQNFTRGYIHHLFRVQELLAYRLASYHNLYFVVKLVSNIREAIINNRFQEMKKEWLG